MCDLDDTRKACFAFSSGTPKCQAPPLPCSRPCALVAADGLAARAEVTTARDEADRGAFGEAAAAGEGGTATGPRRCRRRLRTSLKATLFVIANELSAGQSLPLFPAAWDAARSSHSGHKRSCQRCTSALGPSFPGGATFSELIPFEREIGVSIPSLSLTTRGRAKASPPH